MVFAFGKIIMWFFIWNQRICHFSLYGALGITYYGSNKKLNKIPESEMNAKGSIQNFK
jgi:hypothetical protein